MQQTSFSRYATEAAASLPSTVARISVGLRDHLDRVHRALLEARAAAGAAVVVETVDVPGGLLAVADADRDGLLARHHVAAGEYARAAGLERRRHLHAPVALELHSRHLAQEGGVGLLAERQDHRVGGERLEPAGRLRIAGFVELHQLDLELRTVEGCD